MKRLVFLLVCVSSLGLLATPVVRPGWDWSLPAGVQAAPYSGYMTWGRKRFSPQITVRGVMVTWKRLNPKPGVYDWAWLEDQIAKAKADGMRVGIHLKGVQRDAVPDWVVETLKPVVVDVPVLQDNQPWRIQNVLPWQPKVDAAFHEFMQAFGKTGIAQRDAVVYGYIHGISASRGEEMFIRKIDLKQWQETTGVTPEQFADWLRRRIDAMCEVFHGVEYKLALMFAGPLGSTPAFKKATAGLVDYAIGKGVGVRGGGIDFMHALYVAPAWGSKLEDGYCVVDDTNPVIAERRFRGDENEEYGKYWEWRFGPVEGYPYRQRICTLRGLQMRQNFQMVSPATLELNPELDEYTRLVQGYTRDYAPDAWAYLRETYPGRGTVRNIERWLVQREFPGSRTVPAERVDRFRVPGDAKGKNYDFDARRTDLANGQRNMMFRLDPVFWPQPSPAILKVTVMDRAKTSWRIAYLDGKGQLQHTDAVSLPGDGTRKTVTFELPELAGTRSLPPDAAFTQWLKGLPEPSDVVRNGDFAAGDENWQIKELYRVVPDPEQPARGLVQFDYERKDDTLHMDQMVQLRGGIPYRLSFQVKNAGKGLKPGVRVGRMDWSTVLYLESAKHGEWETLSGVFTPEKDGQYRLQLFGQGRGNIAKGMSGQSFFRDVRVVPLPAEEVVKQYQMDFRIEVEGPGDLTATIVRVIHPDAAERTRQQPER
jgi:hypothetical protein